MAAKVIQFEEAKFLKSNKDIYVVSENNLLMAVMNYMADNDHTSGFNIERIYECIKDVDLVALDKMFEGRDNANYESFKALTKPMQEKVLLNLQTRLVLKIVDPEF